MIKNKAMEAKELRIGNLVKHKGVFVEVTGIDQDWVRLNNSWLNTRIGEIESIELTDDFFVKIGGGNKGGWIGLGWTIDIDYEERAEFMAELMNGIFTLFIFEIPILKVNNPLVHKVQNLYFELTGKELEFKQ